MISVVIPAYNEEKLLPNCLSALKRCETKDYEILVLDADSEDNTKKIAGSFGCKVLKGSRKSVGEARNLGAKAAKGEIVAFMDADSVPCNGWLDLIENAFKENHGIVAVGGPTNYGSAKYLLADYPFWINPLTKYFGFYYFSGNNSAYKKDFFLQQGGFKHIYCEDSEFCKRIGKHRKKMLFINNCTMVLSPRRFEQRGFFRTQIEWFLLNLLINLGIHKQSKGYSAEITR